MAGDVFREVGTGVVDCDLGGGVLGQVEGGEGEADGTRADEGDIGKLIRRRRV